MCSFVDDDEGAGLRHFEVDALAVRRVSRLLSAGGMELARVMGLQWVQDREGSPGCQDGHDGNDEINAAMGEDHDHLAALDAILDEVMC